jgi:hypothetical protein
MDKNNKKDLEYLLVKQTEKILMEIDPATSVIFSKYIKSHCKDLAKKFLKTQRKLKKQLEVITQEVKSSQGIVAKKNVANKSPQNKVGEKKLTPLKKVKAPNTKTPKSIIEAPKNPVQKRVRKGNNLANTATVQNKAKASLSKTIDKTAKG